MSHIKWSWKLSTLFSNSASLCSGMKLFHSRAPWSKDRLLQDTLEFSVRQDSLLSHFPISKRIKERFYLVWAAAPATPQQTLPGALDSWHSDVKLSLSLSCSHERLNISKIANKYQKRVLASSLQCWMITPCLMLRHTCECGEGILPSPAGVRWWGKVNRAVRTAVDVNLVKDNKNEEGD